MKTEEAVAISTMLQPRLDVQHGELATPYNKQVPESDFVKALFLIKIISNITGVDASNILENGKGRRKDSLQNDAGIMFVVLMSRAVPKAKPSYVCRFINEDPSYLRRSLELHLFYQKHQGFYKYNRMFWKVEMAIKEQDHFGSFKSKKNRKKRRYVKKEQKIPDIIPKRSDFVVSKETSFISFCDSLIQTIESELKIPKGALQSKSRKRKYVEGRFIFCFITYFAFQLREPCRTIGYEIGNRDHATVLHSIRSHEKLLETRNCGYILKFCKVSAAHFRAV